MKQNTGIKLVGLLAVCGVSVAIIAAAILVSSPAPQSGGIGCLFYSALTKSTGYIVYATLSSNSTSPVTIERVYFDGSEQAYSTEFLAGVGGIWSMKVGGQSTKVLGVANVSTLLVTATGANADIAHTVRVVTDAGSLEFIVEKEFSSLSFDDYNVFVGPGIDYMVIYVNNVGNATGDIMQVALDGVDYGYVYNVRPPNFRYQWSMAVGSNPTAFIGAGQQAQIYVNISGICHSCTHILSVSCSDGSSVDFSFRP